MIKFLLKNRINIFLIGLLFIATSLVMVISSKSSIQDINRPLPHHILEMQDPLVDMINKLRVSVGLNELKISEELSISSYKRACYLSQKNIWNHNGFSKWINDETPYYKYIGENLARNTNNDEQTFVLFYNSPKHKELMVGSTYQDIGIGRCGNITVVHVGGI